MYSQRVTGPIAPLLTAAEAKQFCRVDFADDDTLISDLIATAEGYLDARDGVTGEALITQTWNLVLAADEVEDGLKLPIRPVQSITSIEYIKGGTTETFGASNYRLTDGRVWLADGAGWPDADAREDAVTITYVAGYGDSADDVPAATVQAARMMVANLYENRGAAEDAESLGFRMMLAASRSERGLF